MTDVTAAVERIVIRVAQDHGLDADVVTSASRFSDDLGMDGLDVGEIIHRAETAFRIHLPDDHITEASRVSDLVDLVADLLAEKAAREERSPDLREAWLDFPPEDAA